ncbi:FadR/GntR family transcriptional regulator [Actinokineospora fastidiosa]|uniref:GntR family transcriptional regulator n=1 Tax=Actinokineospora fastidiosa TaxID=1816 RepID=A0A918GKL8_9PSEU|nr:FCD domain-containing protein [Actinokineospora fastidiosa]GGS39416.1 GntR family transcriptional regulator [Actinokineospora fastidiosa]
MPLATTRRTGLVDQVIEQMRSAIATAEWKVGERIPTEPELVTALGVGRNTVREAVRALAHAGLLEVRQGDGTFVRATSEFSGALRRLVGSELREVLQVRRILEVEGARLAAVNRTEEELRELTEVLSAREKSMEARDYTVGVDKDAEFHGAVMRCSHNTLLTELYQGLTEVVRASVATTVREAPHKANVDHRGLLRAITERDPDRAAAEAAGFLDELLAELADSDA